MGDGRGRVMVDFLVLIANCAVWFAVGYALREGQESEAREV